ncbi:MAG: hypothetical protein LBC86_03260 [Oscillospiraceae bacterium]|jgi:hypothetical protein|nr:hypothetical protein [Oscillospiraceae bacterium]
MSREQKRSFSKVRKAALALLMTGIIAAANLTYSVAFDDPPEQPEEIVGIFMTVAGGSGGDAGGSGYQPVDSGFSGANGSIEYDLRGEHLFFDTPGQHDDIGSLEDIIFASIAEGNPNEGGDGGSGGYAEVYVYADLILSGTLSVIGGSDGETTVLGTGGSGGSAQLYTYEILAAPEIIVSGGGSTASEWHNIAHLGATTLSAKLGDTVTLNGNASMDVEKYIFDITGAVNDSVVLEAAGGNFLFGGELPRGQGLPYYSESGGEDSVTFIGTPGESLEVGDTFVLIDNIFINTPGALESLSDIDDLMLGGYTFRVYAELEEYEFDEFEPVGGTLMAEVMHALNHDDSGAAATCNDPQICAVDNCDYEIEAALGHDYSGTAANCDDPQICARDNCDFEIEKAIGHDESGTAANCNDPQICARDNCDFEIKKAIGHDDSGTAANCDDPQICARDNCDFEIEAALEHDYSGTAANCNDPQICARNNCGYVIETALEHDESGTAANCNDPQICARDNCGYVIETALGHDESGTAATCGEPQICARDNCDYEIKEAIEHNWVSNGDSTHNCTTTGGCGTTDETCTPSDCDDECVKCGYKTPCDCPAPPATPSSKAPSGGGSGSSGSSGGEPNTPSNSNQPDSNSGSDSDPNSDFDPNSDPDPNNNPDPNNDPEPEHGIHLITETGDSLFLFPGAYEELAFVYLNGVLFRAVIVENGDAWELFLYEDTDYGLGADYVYHFSAGRVFEGSTAVLIYSDFISTLINGTYTIIVEFLDGSTGSMDFVVEGSSVDVSEPERDPDTNPGTAVTVSMAMILASGTMIILSRKRK